MSNLACPKCTSTEVRKLSLIYNEGLSTIHTQSTSVGSGVAGGGMAFGSASTHSVGRQQTALSKQAAPPDKKRWLLWSAAAVFVGLISLGNITHPGLWTLIGLGITAMSVKFAVSGRRYNLDVHPGLYQKWEQSFMCNRCGEMFVA